MTNTEEKTGKVQVKGGPFEGDYLKLGMGSGVNLELSQKNIYNCSCLDKKNAEKMHQLESILGNEIVEFKKRLEGVNCSNKFFLDNKTNVGICLTKAEMNKGGTTFIGYGYPLIFKDRNEFKKVIEIRKNYQSCTSNLIKVILFTYRWLNLKDKYFDIIEDNKNVLKDREALNYILKRYFKKSI